MKAVTKIATREAYGEALVELGREFEDVVVLDADLTKSTKTARFKETFPDRFFNMGIAEANLMGVAAGLAAAGKVPFASTFAVFATGRAFEQIRNSIAYPKLNVKIAATHAGITVGADGGSHQSVEDIALMRAVPNMTVLVPADAVEAKALVKAAYHYNGPVYIRLGRPKVPVIFSPEDFFAIGQAQMIREGDHCTVIACGIMTAHALQAAEQLAEEHISVRIINMSTIKPLDVGVVLRAAAETGAIVTAEEHSIIGGLGSAVASVLAEHQPVPLKMVGIKDRFGESGSPDELLRAYGLMPDDIAAAVREVINRKK